MTPDPDTQADIAASLARSTRERGPRWACRTLEAIGQSRSTLAAQPASARTAVVLGAGPSLDLAGPHLQRWQSEGALIIATNTAARACVAWGVQPDVVCVAETDPNVAPHLAGVSPGVVVLSPYAAQETLVAARRVGPVAVAFGPEPALVPIAARLGIEPLWYFGCVAVMGAALARHIGCRRIVLAGVDAAYTDRMYARHTPFADLRPHVERDAQFVGYAVTDLIITLSDLPTPSKKRAMGRAVWVANNAGGQSLTEAQLLAPVDLFVPAARGCELETISPHAVAIEGVRYVDASDVSCVGGGEPVALKPVWALDARAVLSDLESALRAWDVHAEPYPDHHVQLATFWGSVHDAHPLKKLAAQRALMGEAKRAMLEATAKGLGYC